MDFELSEDQQMLQQAAREFAQSELVERAAEADRTEEFVADSIRLCGEMGFLGMSVPEEYGGSALGALGAVLVLTEINKACAATGTTVSVHNSLACESIVRFGSDELKQRYLPKLATGEMLGGYALSEAGSGSDAGSLVCKATQDGDDWILDGTKLWISHGSVCDLVVVFARTDADAGNKGITAFLVESAWEGYKPGKKEVKMGLRGSPTVELHLDKMRVPGSNVLGEVNRGFGIAMGLLDGGRIGIAGQGLGISEACLEAAVKFAGEREQFGKPIAAFGAVQEKIAEMATKLEAARLLTYRAASLKDAGKPHGREASMAKLEASRASNYCAKEALQIHGGAGYTRDFPVERYFRDARVTEIYEGTTEIQKLVIARSYLRP
ncbi:MAG: acyl-CoA dehydrogenase family protein [Planctomycetota bacterium]|nr:acyl-CoA dehydrogenase family protein [Planctomycetota bacterium]